MRLWQFQDNQAIDVIDCPDSFGLTMNPGEHYIHLSEGQIERLTHLLDNYDYICFRRWHDEYIFFPVNDVDVMKKSMLDFATTEAFRRDIVEKSHIKVSK